MGNGERIPTTPDDGGGNVRENEGLVDGYGPATESSIGLRVTVKGRLRSTENRDKWPKFGIPKTWTARRDRGPEGCESYSEK